MGDTSSRSRICTVDFISLERHAVVPSGTGLLEAAREAGIALCSPCGGHGDCGQCRVVLTGRDIVPPRPADQWTFSDGELDSGCRLACSAVVDRDLRVEIPESSLITEPRLQVAGESRRVDPDPLVRAADLEIDLPSLADQRADLERLAQGLDESFGHRRWRADPEVVAQLSQVARRHGWELRTHVRDDQIIGASPTGTKVLGIAIDLGTTKIAAILMDLETGQEISATGRTNPQSIHGDDVVTRLTLASRSESVRFELGKMIHEAFTDMVHELCDDADAEPTQIVDVCVVGNTAMIHLLAGLPVRQLLTAPYVAATTDAIDVRARYLGLPSAPGARVHVLPGVSGFVGSDQVAMVLASEMDDTDRVTLGIDIGTNTEISLARPGQGATHTTSCASGPAFEGAHVSQGMRAGSGAIEAVRILDGNVRVTTINDSPAIGLCGSGIIDAVAEMRRIGVINERGRFQPAPGVIGVGRDAEFMVVPGADSATGLNVSVTQRDVDQIQLAKAAIGAGIEVLLDSANVETAEVEEVVIAGAFGSVLHLEKAMAIGLLPDLPNARYRQVGNAAMAGARRALISRTERARARQIARGLTHVELTNRADFRRRFANAMTLPDPAP